MNPLRRPGLCALFALSSFASLVSAQRPPIRVLFIGNSYTYYNNLPAIVAELASAGKVAVEIEMVAPGGYTLRDHWEKGARERLSSGHWDYVVLQDQSTLGVGYLVDGRARVASDERFKPWAARWVEAIRAAGATPVFFLTWARRDTPEDQAALTRAYVQAASAGRARLAPVGIAWTKVRKDHPAIVLFQDDGSHPSPAGSYLAACSIYATLFGKSPVGLPVKIVGVPVNLDSEQPEPEKREILVDLPAEVARALQETAWAEARKQKRKGHYAQVEPAPPPTPAPVSSAAPLAEVALEGTWRGQLRFYPNGPTAIVLRLARHGDDLTGHLDLDFTSPEQADETFDLTDLRIGEREITFSDPKGIDDLVIAFRGVSTSSGELCGTADATLPEPEPPSLRILGSWCVRRETP